MPELLHRHQIRLRVGPYTVLCLNQSKKPYSLPKHIVQFLEPNKEQIGSHVVDSDDIGHMVVQCFDNFLKEYSNPIKKVPMGSDLYEIYQTKEHYIWIRKNCQNEILLAYQISLDWKEWNLVVEREEENGFDELAYFFAYSILKRGSILFHGVVMDWVGNGIIVCAPSGVGKTTHTNLWQEHECVRILNGDRALCCKEGEEWYTYGAPWCGSSMDCINDKVPLKSIIILEQAANNEVMELLPLRGALELIQLTFAPDWDITLMECAIDQIDDIVQRVPMYKLKCRPDYEAVEVVKSELLNKISFIA